jgi:hypothetical protein
MAAVHRGQRNTASHGSAAADAAWSTRMGDVAGANRGAACCNSRCRSGIFGEATTERCRYSPLGHEAFITVLRVTQYDVN